MHVKYRLARAGIAIHNDPVTGFGKSFLRSDLLSCDKQLSDDLGIGISDIVDRCNMASGDDQYMRRRLGVEVPERYDLVRLMNDIRTDIARCNLAKKAICVTHIRSYPSYRLSQSTTRLPKNACDKVPPSTYSSSPPSGTPCAMRLA